MSDLLKDCQMRLDALLPERDAAVFASNADMKVDQWETAFVEALAIFALVVGFIVKFV